MMSVVASARAQCSGAWLPGQGVPGVNGVVCSMLTLPSGDVVVGGGFDLAGDVAARNIARYNPATGVWSSLGGEDAPLGAADVFDGVDTLALLPDGDVLVGGQFRTIGGIWAENIARLRVSTGTWSALGGEVIGPVSAMLTLPDGDVLVGGAVFTGAAESLRIRIARYNPTTGIWREIAGFTGPESTYRSVSALALAPGGDIIVGGRFDSVGGVRINNIARYAPSTGVWSPLGAGTDNAVRSLAVLPSGDLLVGGWFTLAGGIEARGGARYALDSGAWSALGSGVSGEVFVITPLDSGEVVFGGRLRYSGDVLPRSIARYQPSTDTWLDRSDQKNPIASEGGANAIVSLPGGDLLVGGGFESVGGQPSKGFARKSASTGRWSAVSEGTSGPVLAFATLPETAGGGLIVGGSFVGAGGIKADGVARYTPSSATWSSTGPGVDEEWGDARVNAMLAMPDGRVVVGGLFSSAGGVEASCVAAFDPLSGAWGPLGTGLAGNAPGQAVYALAALPDGDVVVGGDFAFTGGVLCGRIARCNLETNTWSPVGGWIDGSVLALAVLPGGDIVAGGRFTSTSDGAAHNIARYNLSSRTWSAIGDALPKALSYQAIWALAVLPCGDLIAGGRFESIAGVQASGLARYSPSTGVWSAVATGPYWGDVLALAVLPDGDLIVGGNFSSFGGVAARNIARYNPTSGAWSALGDGTNGAVTALAVLPGGDLAVGGYFAFAGGKASAYFARYRFTTSVIDVVRPPSNLRRCAGQSATFTVVAQGRSAEPLKYQWRKGGQPINVTANPSAATSTLTITSVGYADATTYDCVVSDSCTSVTTIAAALSLGRCACNEADVASASGEREPDGCVDNADFSLFLGEFFSSTTQLNCRGLTLPCAAADIADTGSNPGPDGLLDNGDFSLFIGSFFGANCASSCQP